MTLPTPYPGLVISYSYLWAAEHNRGAEEGVKHRPCAIVAARQVLEGREIVTVVPVTHSPPRDAADAVEIPAVLKAYLGLDGARSWIMVTETNDFLWPGPDLRPIAGDRTGRFQYGTLPPRFFAHLRDKVIEAYLRHKVNRVLRSEENLLCASDQPIAPLHRSRSTRGYEPPR